MFSKKRLVLVFLIAFGGCSAAQRCTASRQECRVEKFVDIIEAGIEGALNFVEPTDAMQYIARNCRQRDETLDQAEYDFVVVGSGAAGSAVANRLSEIDDHTTLLLEAGHYENEFIDVPGMSTYAPLTEYNWAYKTVPQEGCCLGMVGRRCQFHRGRGVGGTTLINSVVYSRGAPEDYDKWGAGSAGWCYEDVLPYFKKSERAAFRGQDEAYHGREGLVNVEVSPYDTPHIRAFLEANGELGYEEIDYNGREHLGASRIQYNTLKGRRVTAGAAFVQPVLRRRNLRVSVDSYVTKLHVAADGDVGGASQSRVTGVTFFKDGCEYRVAARREVVLSGGAIGSPFILLHSGIGPREELLDLGVDHLIDLPVGRNLQDHIVIKGLSVATNTSIDIEPLREHVREYLEGEGPFTLAGAHGALGFYKVHPESDSADLEFVFITPNRTNRAFQKMNGFSDETLEALTEHLDSPKTMSALIALEHPKSVGYVRLKSIDPFEYPEINPRFLQDDQGRDVETLYQGVLLFGRMLETRAMRRLDAEFLRIDLPACRHHPVFSRGYWHCFIRQTSDDLFHPVGTCKMGSAEDGGVVDERLRVHGVTNLRVADASVIPFSLSGHTSAPSTMVGERCADFIKEDYNLL